MCGFAGRGGSDGFPAPQEPRSITFGVKGCDAAPATVPVSGGARKIDLRPAAGCSQAYRVPRDQFRMAMVSSRPDALAGPDAPGAPL